MHSALNNAPSIPAVEIVKALETVETACSVRIAHSACTAHSARTGRTNNPSACTILVRFPNPLLEASELGSLTSTIYAVNMAIEKF